VQKHRKKFEEKVDKKAFVLIVKITLVTIFSYSAKNGRKEFAGGQFAKSFSFSKWLSRQYLTKS